MQRNGGRAQRDDSGLLIALLKSTAIGTLLLAVVFAVLWFPRTSMALVLGDTKKDDPDAPPRSFASNLMRQGAILLITCVVFGLIVGNVFVVLWR